MSALTMRDLTLLRRVVEIAERGSRVHWLIEDRIAEGVARSVGDDRGNFLRQDDDVRDGYLRISGTMEHFIPVTRVMDLIAAGEFAED
jgi:hypothetical protein